MASHPFAGGVVEIREDQGRYVRRERRTFIFRGDVKCGQQDEETTVDDKQKRRKVLVDKGWESVIGIISDRQGRRKQEIVMMIPEGQEIRPGDIVWLDNLPGEHMIRSPDGSLVAAGEFEPAEAEPEDTGGDDWDALERELEEIADLLLSNEDKAR